MPYDGLRTARKTVGTKQTLKALEQGRVIKVFIARDADERVVRPVVDLSREKQVELVFVDSMQELGRACGIQVGAASVAIMGD